MLLSRFPSNREITFENMKANLYQIIGQTDIKIITSPTEKNPRAALLAIRRQFGANLTRKQEIEYLSRHIDEATAKQWELLTIPLDQCVQVYDTYDLNNKFRQQNQHVQLPSYVSQPLTIKQTELVEELKSMIQNGFSQIIADN